MTVLKSITAFFIIFVLLVGPWPVDNTHYTKTAYAEKTFNYINRIEPNLNETPLFANSTQIEITPVEDSPLAGYSARNAKVHIGALDNIFAKAITLANKENKITLLSAEILLPLKELVDAILIKTKLNRNQIFFMATHTHSGPGGYAHGLIEEFSLGNFSQLQFDELVDTLSKAILFSREHMQPAKITYSRFKLTPLIADQFITNQLSKTNPAYNSVHTLEVINSDNQKRIATMISFSAHPTLLGRINQKISGDYPNKLVKEIENKIGGVVLFSAGAVGAMLPVAHNKKVEDAEIQIEKRDSMGNGLATIISSLILESKNVDENKVSEKSVWKSKILAIQSEIIPIHLPFPNYRISNQLRLSPFFINWLFHKNRTYIQTLKMGKLFLLSYPADYSGELASGLEDWSRESSIFPWAMSFNGDYIGYVMPSKYYDLDHYTTRDVNFYGRWTGDYLEETSKRIMTHLQ